MAGRCSPSIPKTFWLWPDTEDVFFGMFGGYHIEHPKLSWFWIQPSFFWTVEDSWSVSLVQFSWRDTPILTCLLIFSWNWRANSTAYGRSSHQRSLAAPISRSSPRTIIWILAPHAKHLAHNFRALKTGCHYIHKDIPMLEWNSQCLILKFWNVDCVTSRNVIESILNW